MTTERATSFDQLALSKPLLTALNQLGYEAPTPIQAETIPLLLEGKDVLGQAQTGTGKTAAFALPLISRLDLKLTAPQVLVLAPTRELAIQVAEAFQQYAKMTDNFRVLPIYGGQEYRTQIRGLARGVHVVVGTPGRVMDHMRRGTLKLDKLKTLVLDEADEMLRMGFIDDVKWVLEQLPTERQIALFSATMPKEIERIAKSYLTEPEVVMIKESTTTASTITQRYLMVKGHHKLEALTRILEAETFDGILVFVRTKNATLELAQKLEARGYSATALNGDIAQNQREKTIERLKKGQIDILVATDVAARGLDVERISHVINYDIPYDTEAYVHRIGRTGRAGRSGDAILFVAPRERRLLGAIEKATNQRIEVLELPSTESINVRRIERFKKQISETVANTDLKFFLKMIEEHQTDSEIDATTIAAALAHQIQGEHPFLLSNKPIAETSSRHDRGDSGDSRGFGKESRRDRGSRGENNTRDRDRRDNQGSRDNRTRPVEDDMERFRIEIGFDHDVRPGNIVGAIANEAGIDGEHIGRIDIRDDYSLVDLPKDMPKDIFNSLKKVWVAGQQLNISRAADKSNFPEKESRERNFDKPKKAGRQNSKDSKDSKKLQGEKSFSKKSKKTKSETKANGEKLGGTKFSKKDKD
ncbi:MAG: ATP-dependent RNA helicase DeaD [Gammaproteobacteria bacterium]|jgi:ATP-dependent RNA helicase DeaD